MAFANGFNITFSLKHRIEKMFSLPIEFNLLTDSLSIFYVLTKEATTTENAHGLSQGSEKLLTAFLNQRCFVNHIKEQFR